MSKVIPTIKEKKAEIRDNYNQLSIAFKSGLVVEFRAYDNGVAYRFVTNQKGELVVKNELINFNLPPACKIYFPEEESMHSHNEREFKHILLIVLVQKVLFFSAWKIVSIYFYYLEISRIIGYKLSIR